MKYNIIDIHIQRSRVGKVFPFDKLYLVHKTDAEFIGNIFQYAMVLPLRKVMLDLLCTLVPELIHLRHHNRKDADLKKESKLDNVTAKAWWTAFVEEHELTQRLAVIPVLTATARHIIRPRYLTSKKWEKAKVRAVTSPITTAYDEFAYLATPLPAPQNKIAPICMICPRMLLQLQGECTPGDEVCYRSLNFAAIKDSDASVQQDDHNDYRLP